ncbi:MAG: choice-of-anchor P family protein, partial [Gaiellaceae bacterium]
MQRRSTAALALLAFVLPVGSAGATETAPEASATAQAVAIRIVAPGQIGAVVGAVSAPPEASSSEAGFAYPADGSVLTAGTVSASASAGTAAGNATATAAADVASVSIFGGEVTVAAVAARARASTSGTSATGGVEGAGVSGFSVAGVPVGAGAGARVALGDWGYATASQQSSGAGAAAPSFRAAMTGVSIFLTTDHGGLPAGSEITLGSAEVSAQGTPPPPP